MTPTRKREIQAFLTGRIPLEFRDKKIEPPEDMEVKDWLCNASPDLVHLIGRGPNGDTFRKNANEAMTRITKREMEGKPPANGRSSGAFLEFAPTEVSSGVSLVDPERKK